MKDRIKILYFFPENPLLKNAGNKTRVLNLLDYFKSKDILVDFVSDDIFDFKTEEEKVQLVNKGLANQVTILKRKPKKDNLFKYLTEYKIPRKFYKKKGHYSRVWFYHKIHFKQLLKETKYDYIIISYIFFMDLIDREYTKGAKVILDTHDFITANCQYEKDFLLGAWFQEEIEIANKADEVWAISNDEYYVFTQFCKNEVRLIPFWEEDNTKEDINIRKEYDLIYVASDNPHNIKSCQWFFSEVYPLLPPTITICVIGKITNHVEEYSNVTKIRFVESLKEYYQRTRISVCPMLTGTGVKVKVIEALSYGLPIVCTLRGVDGLSNKTNNGCWVAENEKEFAENIIKLLNNPELYKKYKKQSVEYFLENYSKEIGYKKLDSIFSKENVDTILSNNMNSNKL